MEAIIQGRDSSCMACGKKMRVNKGDKNTQRRMSLVQKRHYRIYAYACQERIIDNLSPHLGDSIDHRDLVLARRYRLARHFDSRRRCLSSRNVFFFLISRSETRQSSRRHFHHILQPLIERRFDLLQSLCQRCRRRGRCGVYTGTLVNGGTGICSGVRSRRANDRLGRRYVQGR